MVRPRRRRRRMQVVALLVVLVAIGVWAAWRWHRPPQSQPAAIAPPAAADEEEFTATERRSLEEVLRHKGAGRGK